MKMEVGRNKRGPQGSALSVWAQHSRSSFPTVYPQPVGLCGILEEEIQGDRCNFFSPAWLSPWNTYRRRIIGKVVRNFGSKYGITVDSLKNTDPSGII